MPEIASNCALDVVTQPVVLIGMGLRGNRLSPSAKAALAFHTNNQRPLGILLSAWARPRYREMIDFALRNEMFDLKPVIMI